MIERIEIGVKVKKRKIMINTNQMITEKGLRGNRKSLIGQNMILKLLKVQMLKRSVPNPKEGVIIEIEIKGTQVATLMNDRTMKSLHRTMERNLLVKMILVIKKISPSLTIVR